MPAFYFERTETVVSGVVVIADTEAEAREALDLDGAPDAPIVYDETVEQPTMGSDGFILKTLPEVVRVKLILQGHLPAEEKIDA